MSDQAIEPHAETAPAQLIQLQQPDEYRAARPHVFETADSFRWFVRNHRDELIQAGALLMPTGRWLVRPELFDLCLVAIGLRKAAERKSD